MVDSKSDILNLVNEYVLCADYMCNLFKDHFDLKGEILLRARRLNLIPKEGEIEGVRFNFHGGGCFFEFQNGCIEVDFGPDGRCDGFDEFRLFDFLQSNGSNKYKSILDENLFKNEFKKLIDDNIIYCPGWYPNPGLFYLADTVNSSE